MHIPHLKPLNHQKSLYFCSMGRILAIDYGTKRTGIAVTDPGCIIANGLTTVKTFELMNFLKDYFQKETVDCIVIGKPSEMSGKPSDNARNIDLFIKQFRTVFP